MDRRRDTAFMQRFAQLRDYTTMCNSAPSEVLGQVAMRNEDAIFTRHRDRVATHLGRLESFVAATRGVLNSPARRDRPSASFVCSRNRPRNWLRRCAQEHGLMLVPSTVFEDSGDHHVRIGMGLKNFPECLEVFGRVLDQVPAGG